MRNVDFQNFLEFRKANVPGNFVSIQIARAKIKNKNKIYKLNHNKAFKVELSYLSMVRIDEPYRIPRRPEEKRRVYLGDNRMPEGMIPEPSVNQKWEKSSELLKKLVIIKKEEPERQKTG